jgi:hypothetical protein
MGKSYGKPTRYESGGIPTYMGNPPLSASILDKHLPVLRLLGWYRRLARMVINHAFETRFLRASGVD